MSDLDSFLWGYKIVIEVCLLSSRKVNHSTIATFEVTRSFAGNLKSGTKFDAPANLQQYHSDPFASMTVIEFPHTSPGKSAFLLLDSLPLVAKDEISDFYEVISIDEGRVHYCDLTPKGLIFDFHSKGSVAVADIYPEIEAALQRNQKLEQKIDTLTDSDYTSGLVAILKARTAREEIDPERDRITMNLCKRLAKRYNVEANDQVILLRLGHNSLRGLYHSYASPSGREHMLMKILDQSLTDWQRRSYIEAVEYTGFHYFKDISYRPSPDYIGDNGLYLTRIAQAAFTTRNNFFVCAHILKVLHYFFDRNLDIGKIAPEEVQGVSTQVEKLFPLLSGLPCFRAKLLLDVCQRPITFIANRYLLTCVYPNDLFRNLDTRKQTQKLLTEAQPGKILKLSIGIYDSRRKPQPEEPESLDTMSDEEALIAAIRAPPSVEIHKSYLHFQCKTKDLYQKVELDFYLTAGGYLEYPLYDWRLPKDIPVGDYTVTLRCEDKAGQQIAEYIPYDVRVLPAKKSELDK
ncbi:MAG: hypothetical protein AAF518_20620 [Spirochaetota bacterium]